MSEIRAATISNAAGTGPATLTGQNAAKAAYHLVMSTATGNGDNISSFTDNGAGDFSVSFTNNFNAETDMYPTFGGSPQSGTSRNYSYGLTVTASDFTTSSIRTINESSDGLGYDLTNTAYGGMIGGTLA